MGSLVSSTLHALIKKIKVAVRLVILLILPLRILAVACFIVRVDLNSNAIVLAHRRVVIARSTFTSLQAALFWVY